MLHGILLNAVLIHDLQELNTRFLSPVTGAPQQRHDIAFLDERAGLRWENVSFYSKFQSAFGQYKNQLLNKIYFSHMRIYFNNAIDFNIF